MTQNLNYCGTFVYIVSCGETTVKSIEQLFLFFLSVVKSNIFFRFIHCMFFLETSTTHYQKSLQISDY